MAAQAQSKQGGSLWLAALGVVGAASWAAGFYFRAAPVGSPLVRAEPVSIGEAPSLPATRPSPSRPLASTALATGSDRPATAPTDGGVPAAADAGLDGGGDAGAVASATAAAGSSSASAPASSAAGSASVARQPPRTAAETTACVVALFPEGSFAAYRPDLSFVCKERYPRRGVTRVQSQVAKGNWGTGTATDGMREWAALGWYQLAAYALMRGQCCETAVELDWTFKLACPLDQAMSELESAVRLRKAGAVDRAIHQYTQTATCLTKLGQARNFGQKTLPGAGLSSLERFVERAGVSR